MFTLNCKGRLLLLEKPVVMGIINLTPDSFYSGSRQQATDAVLAEAGKMLQEGAMILDLGAQSTRPGSERVSEEEELKRLLPALEALSQQFPEAYISVDTFYASVAKAAVEAGACMVNDISAGNLDPAMISTVASLSVPYVLMHMKGSPQTMQQNTDYTDVTREVLDYLIWKKAEITKAGIRDIIIDPGFGFAKNAAQNFTLLKNIHLFRLLDAPLLLGISRKSFIWKTLGLTPEEALEGTIAMNTAGLLGGAAILRVHDVKEAVQTIKLVTALQAG
ncbi:MAG: dihydropteroate synthase [Chitinophagaceae bacterium]|nr:dihydropteroate synthase [Chitinophagaceae bacterium]MBP8243479.1 dihydropteroate synthase [Chitinophagaceae bacterium]